MEGFSCDEREVEAAKQRIRDLWAYKPVDKIPLNFGIYSNPKKYTLHEQIRDVDKQLEVSLASIRRTMELIPRDFIPHANTDIGNVIVENAFGLRSEFPENPDQTPIWREPLLKNLEEAYTLKIPNPYEDDLFQESLKRLRYWSARLGNRIYTGSLDMGGPTNTAYNLAGSVLFYEGLIDNPEAIHVLLEKATVTYLIYYALLVDAAGGLDRMGTIYPSLWCPEGRKGAVADDVCANISPQMFKQFSRPYNARIYRIYGAGWFHNCGPNPCVAEYIDPEYPIGACNLFYDYSKGDLSAIADAFDHRAVAYMSWWGSDPPEKVIREYQQVSRMLAPKTACILQYSVDDSLYSDRDILNIFEELNRISIEYTRSMKWNSTSRRLD